MAKPLLPVISWRKTRPITLIWRILSAVQPDDAWFWATHQGAEIDLLLRKHGQMVGVECKRTDTPRMTPSIRTALSDLNLDRVIVVYPGDKRFSLSDQVEAMPLKYLASDEQLSELAGYSHASISGAGLKNGGVSG